MLHVGHDHVDRLFAAEGTEALDPEQELAAGHPLLDAAFDRLRRGDIGGGDRLLVPGEVLGLESTGDLDREIDVEEAVAVDQDVDIRPDCGPDRLYAGDAEVGGRGDFGRGSVECGEAVERSGP